jgi:nucleotide-binding universal stress UspA family protein
LCASVSRPARLDLHRHPAVGRPFAIPSSFVTRREIAVAELLLENRAHAALPQCTEGAVLAVVGSRGRGRLSGLLLGSTSQAMLARADCPVAVVRGVDPS